MNPFTRFLAQWAPNKSRRLDAFISRWDMLERLVIRVYKSDVVAPEDRRLFAETWPWLRRHYETWAPALAPFWPETRVDSIPAPQDPFRLLLAISAPQEIRNNWAAMQYLPAAREALNRMLLEGNVR